MTIPMGRAERRRAPGRPHQFLHALHLQGFQTMKEVAQAFLLWAVAKSRTGCLKIVESLWIMGFHSIYQLVQDFFHPQERWRVTLKAAPKNMKAPAGCLRLSSYLCHENIAIFASFWGMPLRIYIQFIHEWTKEICGTATSAEFTHEGMMSMICVPFKETNYQWPLDWQGVQNVLVIMSFLNVTSIIYPLGLWFIPFFMIHPELIRSRSLVAQDFLDQSHSGRWVHHSSHWNSIFSWRVLDTRCKKLLFYVSLYIYIYICMNMYMYITSLHNYTYTYIYIYIL